MSDIVVKAEHLSKMYRLGVINNGTLWQDIQTYLAIKFRKEDPHSKIGEDRYSGDKDHFWALKDISFEIKQGDLVGIIGKNGAGKSTFLKILSRITTPTEGLLKVKGKIASLLEVGTGFHGELTGRENIYINGAILGMKKRQIDKKIDEIIAFSGIEKHIDTPVKRYSSGMYVRLAFAVAAHLESDILIADEVLAVGDAEFQNKAIGKMQGLSTGEGRTVLFVSHNMGAVKKLCNHGIILKEGRVDYIGDINSAIDHYTYVPESDPKITKMINNSMRIENIKTTLDVQFVSVQFEEKQNQFTTDEEIAILFKVKGNKDVDSISLNATINTSDNIPVGSVFGKTYFSIKNNEYKDIRFSLINHNLTLGDYVVSFSLGTGNASVNRTEHDIIFNVISFKITKYSSKSNTGYSKWYKNWGNIIFNSEMSVT